MSESGFSHTLLLIHCWDLPAPLLWVCYLQHPLGTGKLCAGERGRGEISVHVSKMVEGEGLMSDEGHLGHKRDPSKLMESIF